MDRPQQQRASEPTAYEQTFRGTRSEPLPLVRRRRPTAAADYRLSELPGIPCRVLLASDDVPSVTSLKTSLQGALALEHVRHIGELMDIAPSAKEERVVLVLDCHSPTMHPASVAGLSEELPYGWWIVAWGIDSLTWDELEPDRQGPLHWVRCADDANWNDVLGLTNTLLGAGR